VVILRGLRAVRTLLSISYGPSAIRLRPAPHREPRTHTMKLNNCAGLYSGTSKVGCHGLLDNLKIDMGPEPRPAETCGFPMRSVSYGRAYARNRSNAISTAVVMLGVSADRPSRGHTTTYRRSIALCAERSGAAAGRR
jgi:hypothetical protein